MKPQQKHLTYQVKLRQANREAAASVIALVVIVAAWTVLGFGLAPLDLQILHTPLWVLGGTLGTWAVALAACVFLAKRVFADFPFEDEPADSGESASANPAAAKEADHA